MLAPNNATTKCFFACRPPDMTSGFLTFSSSLCFHHSYSTRVEGLAKIWDFALLRIAILCKLYYVWLHPTINNAHKEKKHRKQACLNVIASWVVLVYF